MTRCPHTELIAQEVLRRGGKVRWLHDYLFTGTVLGRPVVFWSTRSALTTQVAAHLVAYKDVSARFLAEAGIPVPEGKSFTEWTEALAWSTGRWPVVVKPTRSKGAGRGCTKDVVDHQRFQAAFAHAIKFGDRVLVERQVYGREARFLVIGGRCVHVLLKHPDPDTGELLTGTYEEIAPHPSHVEIVENTVAAIPGLGLAGLDVIAPEFSEPGGTTIVEVNAAPGIRGHCRPHIGKGVNVPSLLVDALESHLF